MFRLSFALILTVAAVPLSAAEPDPQTLLKERGCVTCHDLSNYNVGPPLKSVAVKYRSNPAAGEQRITSALKDGIGHPKTDASPEEIKALIDWILSL